MSYDVKEGSTSFEVDFVEGDALLGEATSLLQVSSSIAARSTRKRELRSLEKAMVASGVDTGTVITLNERETIAADAGSIEVVPVWRWLLREM
jgi:predicted AAA+ superfamily ATPase